MGLWHDWFGVSFKGWDGPRPDPSLYCDLRERRMEEWLQTAWRDLNHNPRPDPHELIRVLSDLTGQATYSGTVTTLAKRYRLRYPDLATDGLGLRRPLIELAAAGAPRSDPFRSVYERRTAAALTRLGLPWAYEPDVFTWRDYRNMLHRYTPDFRLLDYADTYVEVKGPAGADAADTMKLQRVVAWHPHVTLLLWDAAIIDYIEDVTDPAAILALLRTTKAA